MSEKNNKLYVFDKKEIVLIFFFVFFAAVTSFSLGVRIGKSFSFKISGLAKTDKDYVELKSAVEEQVETLMANRRELAGDDQAGEKTKQLAVKRKTL